MSQRTRLHRPNSEKLARIDYGGVDLLVPSKQWHLGMLNVCFKCKSFVVTRKGVHVGTLNQIARTRVGGMDKRLYIHDERSTPCPLMLAPSSPKGGSLGIG